MTVSPSNPTNNPITSAKGAIFARKTANKAYAVVSDNILAYLGVTAAQRAKDGAHHLLDVNRKVVGTYWPMSLQLSFTDNYQAPDGLKVPRGEFIDLVEAVTLTHGLPTEEVIDTGTREYERQQEVAGEKAADKAANDLIEREYARLKAQEEARQRLRKEQAAELIGEAGEVRIFSGTEFMGQELPTNPGRIAGLWNWEGHAQLNAKSKAGKSTLTHNIMESLTTGRPFLNMFDVIAVQGNITLMDFELPQSKLQEYLGYLDIDMRRVNVVPMRDVGPHQFDPRDPDNLKEWAEKLRAANTEVLIVDCLSPIVDAHGIDNNTNAVAQLIRAIHRLCALAGVQESLILDHQSEKSNSAGGTSSMGYSGKMGIYDNNWTLVKHGQGKDATFTLDTTGRVEEKHLDLVRNGYYFVPADGSKNVKSDAEIHAGLLREIFLQEVEKYHAEQLKNGVDEESANSWPSPSALVNAVKGRARAKYSLGRPAVVKALDWLTGTGVFNLKPGKSRGQIIIPAVNKFVPNVSRRQQDSEKAGVSPDVIDMFSRPGKR